MRTSELQYELPPELIAQAPVPRRDESRLLVYDRATGAVRHRLFRDLHEELPPRSLVVVNDTRVLPARLELHRPAGGQTEVLLLEPVKPEATNGVPGGGLWEALARPSRRLREGMQLRGDGKVTLVRRLGQGRWLVTLDRAPAGAIPLPPYIHEQPNDLERYQTVYADEEGSAAAPTAGLHFTTELLSRLDVERVTLHVGLDTFRPVTTAEVEQHAIHGERYRVSALAWERIRVAQHVTAVGTTSVRTIEALSLGAPLQGRTSLFITPGFTFERVDALVTNFHLPCTSLLALTMAFAGIEQVRELYQIAIEERYRFYSFGDAMLLL